MDKRVTVIEQELKSIYEQVELAAKLLAKAGDTAAAIGAELWRNRPEHSETNVEEAMQLRDEAGRWITASGDLGQCMRDVCRAIWSTYRAENWELSQWIFNAGQHALPLTKTGIEGNEDILIHQSVAKAQGDLAIVLLQDPSRGLKPCIIGCVQDTSESLALVDLAEGPDYSILREFPSNEDGRDEDYGGKSVTELLADVEAYLATLPGQWKLVDCDWARVGHPDANLGECLREVKEWLKEVCGG